jgi:hypothetical protein
MGDIGIYVVAATSGSETRYWAAAMPQNRAVDEVQRLLPSGWRVILTDRHLTPERIAELGIHSNSVRELKFIP